MEGVTAEGRARRTRRLEVDMAKGLAVLTMVFIHVYELFRIDKVSGYGLSAVMEFLGGPLSAPTFMVAMGVGMAYTRRREPAAFARRGVLLILQGYLLNVLRSGPIYLLAYVVYRDPEYLAMIPQDLLVLDILHFAGLSFLVVAACLRLRARPWHIAMVAVVMSIIATAVGSFSADSMEVSAVTGYFFYQNEYTCFPLFSWFVFPAAGLCLGDGLQKLADERRFYTGMLAVCLVLFALYTAVLRGMDYDISGIFLTFEGFYGMGVAGAAWILLINGALYALLYFCSGLVKRRGARRLIELVGSGVNDIYIAQWVVVMAFNVLLFRDTQLSIAGFVALACVITVLSGVYAYVKREIGLRNRAGSSGLPG